MKTSEAMLLTFLAAMAVVGVLGLTWVFQGNDFFLYRYFAPKEEAVRRQVFEQSKAYNQGMVQEIQNMQFQYVQASPEQKKALAAIILHRTADYDMSQMPPDTWEFVSGLRQSREMGK